MSFVTRSCCSYGEPLRCYDTHIFITVTIYPLHHDAKVCRIKKESGALLVTYRTIAVRRLTFAERIRH